MTCIFFLEQLELVVISFLLSFCSVGLVGVFTRLVFWTWTRWDTNTTQHNTSRQHNTAQHVHHSTEDATTLLTISKYRTFEHLNCVRFAFGCAVSRKRLLELLVDELVCCCCVLCCCVLWCVVLFSLSLHPNILLLLYGRSDSHHTTHADPCRVVLFHVISTQHHTTHTTHNTTRTTQHNTQLNNTTQHNTTERMPRPS